MRPKSKEKVYLDNILTKNIKPSKLNPRKVFDLESINELAKSFSEYGMIQPIILYRKGSKYIIICGERRWRAAKKVNFATVPAIVHPSPPKDEVSVSMALIENMHRKDVDLVSESVAIRNLIENYCWSKEKVSKELGVSIAYIRNRLLLTRFSDILDSYNKKEISFSEAIALASIKHNSSRKDFLKRLLNNEFKSYNDLTEKIARYKQIKKVVDKGSFLSRSLSRSLIMFDVPGLKYCNQACEYYLRITWEEKRQFGLPTNKPGWDEYCTAVNNGCYEKKKVARHVYIQELRETQNKRPIPYDGWESMLWFKYRKKMCKICDHMVDAADFEVLGGKSKKGIYAYCTAEKPNCYETRCVAYEKMGKNRYALLEEMKTKRKNKILNEIFKKKPQIGKSAKSYITKAECAYLIMQFLCYAGGKNRLERFVKKYFSKNNMPSRALLE